MRTLWDTLTQEQQEKMTNSTLSVESHIDELKKVSFPSELSIFVWYTLKLSLGFNSIDEAFDGLIHQFTNFDNN